jgi:hypothetical protein
MATGPRGKLSVLLVSGVRLYGTANRLEFARAIGSDERYPWFKLTKHRFEGGVKVIPVRGDHVSSFDWVTPAPAKRRKARAKPAANGLVTVEAIVGGPLSILDGEHLAEETKDLDENALRMLCIEAAGVDSIDELTQATVGLFREALAGERA